MIYWHSLRQAFQVLRVSHQSDISQYEIVFSDSYISDEEAESSLAYSSSSLSAHIKATSVAASTATSEVTAELSTRPPGADDTIGSSAGSDFMDVPESYEYMVLDSLPYLCSIPQVNKQKNESATSSSKGDEEKELARATDRGWELLKDMEGNCMYFVSGWWSYAFCYNKEVKQFHALPPGRAGTPIFPPTEDESVPSFVLGHFQDPRQSTKQVEGGSKGGKRIEQKTGAETTQIQTKGDMRYMVQKLGGGSTCDITGRPRKIEVQFHCHPQSADRIGWIKEVSTCAYLMVIYTPRLCNDVAFLPPKEHKAHQIICREIVSEDGIAAWKARKAADTERKLIGTKEAATSARPVVGGIEVGGMKQVGQNGKRIDPPKVFDPTETHTEVVAKFDPKEGGGKVQKLSAQDLKNLELNPTAVQQMQEELQKMANNKAWRLEIVENGAGMRELRGILEDDDEEEGEKKGSGKVAKEAEGRKEDNEEGSEETYKDEL